MSFRQFGFEHDEEEFFKDVFDSSQRKLQLARYSGARRKNLLFFYGSSLFLVVFVLLYLAFEKSGTLLMAFVALYQAMLSLFGAMSADGKYRMTRIVDELVQQRGMEWEKKC